MRIVYIGTVEFSKIFLEKIVSCGANVVGVCTKSSSKFNSDFANITDVCVENNIEFKYSTDINSPETVNWISQLKPDIIFCFGWSSLIKDDLLSLPPMGVVGFHPAAIPMNRGRHPLIWTIFLGLKETASTFFFMDSGADTGDILSQRPVFIDDKETADNLYNKVAEVAKEQIAEFIPQLESGYFSRKKQDQSVSNFWRKRSKIDGKIDFRMSSKSICRLIRALSNPYPGAHVLWGNDCVKVWEAEEVNCDKTNYEPGKVLSVVNGHIMVKTYDSAINITKHDFIDFPKEGDYL